MEKQKTRDNLKSVEKKPSKMVINGKSQQPLSANPFLKNISSAEMEINMNKMKNKNNKCKQKKWYGTSCLRAKDPENGC